MKKRCLPIILALLSLIAPKSLAYLDTDTGEFITKDPTGFVDGPNLYTYVNQNPWTYFDPEGLQLGMSGNGNAALLQACGDGQTANQMTQSSQSFTNLEHGIVMTGEAAANLNPVQNALTAGTGKGPLGEDVGKVQQGLAFTSVLPIGESIEVLGNGLKIVVDASKIEPIEQTATTIYAESKVAQVTADAGQEAQVLARTDGVAKDAKLAAGSTLKTAGGGGGGGLLLNLGGEGELPGYIDVNPLVGNRLSMEQIIARNPTGGFLQAGAENFAEHFEAGSVSDIQAIRLPSVVLAKHTDAIATNISKVLESGATATIRTSSGMSVAIPSTFETQGLIIKQFDESGQITVQKP